MLSCRHVLSHNQRRGQRWVIHLLVFFHSHCLALATLQHLCHLDRATAPSLFPFVMWKQPFSCGDSLSFHPDAWHSWQIGCGSEGDGLWKQCPCPRYTHEHIYTKATRSTNTKNISRVCVFTILHTIPLDTQPRYEAKHKGYVANGVMTWMYNTQRKQEMEILTSFTSSFHSNMCFSPTSSMQLQYRTLGYLQICSSFSILRKRKEKENFLPYLWFVRVNVEQIHFCISNEKCQQPFSDYLLF